MKNIKPLIKTLSDLGFSLSNIDYFCPGLHDEDVDFISESEKEIYQKRINEFQEVYDKLDTSIRQSIYAKGELTAYDEEAIGWELL